MFRQSLIGHSQVASGGKYPDYITMRNGRQVIPQGIRQSNPVSFISNSSNSSSSSGDVANLPMTKEPTAMTRTTRTMCKMSLANFAKRAKPMMYIDASDVNNYLKAMAKMKSLFREHPKEGPAQALEYMQSRYELIIIYKFDFIDLDNCLGQHKCTLYIKGTGFEAETETYGRTQREVRNGAAGFMLNALLTMKTVYMSSCMEIKHFSRVTFESDQFKLRQKPTANRDTLKSNATIVQVETIAETPPSQDEEKAKKETETANDHAQADLETTDQAGPSGVKTFCQKAKEKRQQLQISSPKTTIYHDYEIPKRVRSDDDTLSSSDSAVSASYIYLNPLDNVPSAKTFHYNKEDFVVVPSPEEMERMLREKDQEDNVSPKECTMNKRIEESDSFPAILKQHSPASFAQVEEKTHDGHDSFEMSNEDSLTYVTAKCSCPLSDNQPLNSSAESNQETLSVQSSEFSFNSNNECATDNGGEPTLQLSTEHNKPETNGQSSNDQPSINQPSNDQTSKNQPSNDQLSIDQPLNDQPLNSNPSKDQELEQIRNVRPLMQVDPLNRRGRSCPPVMHENEKQFKCSKIVFDVIRKPHAQFIKLANTKGSDKDMEKKCWSDQEDLVSISLITPQVAAKDKRFRVTRRKKRSCSSESLGQQSKSEERESYLHNEASMNKTTQLPLSNTNAAEQLEQLAPETAKQEGAADGTSQVCNAPPNGQLTGYMTQAKPSTPWILLMEMSSDSETGVFKSKQKLADSPNTLAEKKTTLQKKQIELKVDQQAIESERPGISNYHQEEMMKPVQAVQPKQVSREDAQTQTSMQDIMGTFPEQAPAQPAQKFTRGTQSTMTTNYLTTNQTIGMSGFPAENEIPRVANPMPQYTTGNQTTPVYYVQTQQAAYEDKTGPAQFQTTNQANFFVPVQQPMQSSNLTLDLLNGNDLNQNTLYSDGHNLFYVQPQGNLAPTPINQLQFANYTAPNTDPNLTAQAYLILDEQQMQLLNATGSLFGNQQPRYQ